MNNAVIDDLDKNNNKLPFLNLNKTNQENMDVPPMIGIEKSINQNNIVDSSRVTEIGKDTNSACYTDDNNGVNKGCEPDESKIESPLVIGSDMDKPVDSESTLTVTSNYGSSNIRKNRKKKRHYNINKNKKWIRTYKRLKPDTDSASQNNRKHTYTKVPKVIFNNKQALHRGSGLSKFFLPDKRPRDIIVPPTKFLLGGNISDPLNLNSLQDEALVSISAVTPKSSPIPTPPKVEVIIPPNIYDPLHLLDPVDSIEYEKQLVSPIKSRRLNRQRSRKKKIKKCDVMEAGHTNNTELDSSDVVNISPSSKDIDAATESEETSEQAENTNVEDNVMVGDKTCFTNNTRKRKSSECIGFPISIHGNGSGSNSKKLRRFDKDKIVSPVIPQPGAWKRPPKVQLGAPRNRNRTTSLSGITKYTMVYGFFLQ